MEVNTWLNGITLLFTIGLGVALYRQNTKLVELNSKLTGKREVSLAVSVDKRSILKKITTFLSDYMKEFSSIKSIDPFDDDDLKYHDYRGKLIEAIKELDYYTDNKRLKTPYNRLLILENQWGGILMEYHWEHNIMLDHYMKFNEDMEPYLNKEGKKEIKKLDDSNRIKRDEFFTTESDKITEEFTLIIRAMNHETE